MTKKKSDTCKAGCGMKLQPLGDRLVIRRDESQDRTSGGLYLPDSGKDKQARGIVVSVGDGRTLDDGTRSVFTVKEGDRVLFLAYAGEEFKFGDDELLLMRESDLLAVIE